MSLLTSSDGPAFEVVNLDGASSAFLVCDHASHRIPGVLGDLALPENDRLAHIGWDIGAALVARRLSELLDASLVLAGFSRLVIDCNRPLGSPSSIPEETGGVIVPGNRGITAEMASARAEACFWPYHRAITSALDERVAKKRRTSLLAIHSFTPELLGQKRPWHTGILYGHEDVLARRWLAELRKESELCVGDNEPYRVTDGGDYTLPVHAEKRNIEGILIEIRQDLVSSPGGVTTWAERLARAHRAIEADSTT